MSFRSVHCNNCHIDFLYDAGEIIWDGPLPKPSKNPVCPKCQQLIPPYSNLSAFAIDLILNPRSDSIIYCIDLLLGAQTWEERRSVLEKHPELLSEEAENEMRQLLTVSKSISPSDEILGDEQILRLINRCRLIGIDKTFDELTGNHVKFDYFEYCHSFNYFPDQIDWRQYWESKIPEIKNNISDVRKSVLRQNVPDLEIDNKSDAEILADLFVNVGDPYSFVYSNISVEIKEGANKLGYTFPIPFYCGIIPIGSFNAHVKRTSNGAIILVYNELSQFVHTCIEANILSQDISHIQSDFSLNDIIFISPLTSKDEAIEIIGRAVIKFFTCGSFGPPAPYPQGGPAGEIIYDQTLSTIRFVVAHECGHILGNHLGLGETNLPISPMQDFINNESANFLSDSYSTEIKARVAKNWEKERLADQYGFELCVAPFWPTDGSKEKIHNVSTRLSGIFNYFSLDYMLNECMKVYQGNFSLDYDSASHPPSELRSYTIEGWIRQLSVNADNILVQAKIVSNWFRNVTPNVCDYVLANKKPKLS